MALEKKGLETTGSREQLIARIKSAGIDVFTAIDPAEAAEIEKEEKAKKAAKAHLEQVAAEYADMKAPELRTELEKRKLSTKGKKAELMERLAVAAEEEYAANAEKEGVVTLPSGLQYKVLHQGTGRTPGPSDDVPLDDGALRFPPRWPLFWAPGPPRHMFKVNTKHILNPVDFI